MSKFLETLNQKFDRNCELDLIVEYLTAMTKVNRFNLIVKMLDNKVKEGNIFILVNFTQIISTKIIIFLIQTSLKSIIFVIHTKNTFKFIENNTNLYFFII